jgi:hypothetical protein
MASTFKNAGMTVGTNDNVSANLYTATGVTAVIHALYISNKSITNTANVDIKVTTDGGTTFRTLGKGLSISPETTLIMDKPINLETNDIIRVIADLNVDSSSPEVDVFASILEIS